MRAMALGEDGYYESLDPCLIDQMFDRGLVAGVEGNKVRLSAIGAVAVTLEEEKK